MITQTQELTQTIAHKSIAFAKDGQEASLSLVFLTGGILDIDDLAAIKEAARVCDVAIAVSLLKPLSKAQQALAHKAGAAILYAHQLPPKRLVPCTLRTQMGDDITPYLEVLLLTMPSVTVTTPERMQTHRAISSIAGQFPWFLTHVVAQTPVAALDDAHKNLLVLMQNAQTLAEHGERRVEALLHYVLAVFSKQGVNTVHQLAVIDAATLLEVRQIIPLKSYLFAEVSYHGRRLQRHLLLSL